MERGWQDKLGLWFHFDAEDAQILSMAGALFGGALVLIGTAMFPWSNLTDGPLMLPLVTMLSGIILMTASAAAYYRVTDLCRGELRELSRRHEMQWRRLVGVSIVLVPVWFVLSGIVTLLCLEPALVHVLGCLVMFLMWAYVLGTPAD